MTKQWDSASPQLLSALSNNEVLRAVDLEFVRTSPDGKEQVYQTIHLENTTVVTIHALGGDGSKTSHGTHERGIHELEEIEFQFMKIEVTHVDGKTSNTDNWMAAARDPSPVRKFCRQHPRARITGIASGPRPRDTER